MNDLEAIAELAADAPLPQLADMSAARLRLDAAIAAELTGAPAVIGARSGIRHGQASRRRWIAGGAGALVIGAAAAVAVAVALPGGSARNGGPQAATGQSEPSVRTATLTAKQVLDSAAAAALTGAPVIPRPDQYVYVKINDGNGIVQSWYSVDGRHNGLSSNAGFPPVVVPGCLPTASCTPRPAFFLDMPTTASAIGPWLAQTQGASTANPNVLAKIAGMILENDYLLPAQRAALYEFLAATPGLTVVHGIEDPLGRAGVGITWTSGGSATLVFDAGTLAYLGWNTVGVHGEKGGDALLGRAIVDRAGELPNS